MQIQPCPLSIFHQKRALSLSVCVSFTDSVLFGYFVNVTYVLGPLLLLLMLLLLFSAIAIA